MSPKIIERQNVFALDDESCTPIGVPSGDTLTLRCEPMPAARQADLVRLHLQRRGIRGTAVIEMVGEVGGRLDDKHYTVLVVSIRDSEQEVA